VFKGLIVALRNIANIVDPILYTSHDRESWGSTISKFDMAFQICTIISVCICVAGCSDYGLWIRMEVNVENCVRLGWNDAFEECTVQINCAMESACTSVVMTRLEVCTAVME